MAKYKKIVQKPKKSLPWFKLVFTCVVILGAYLIYLDAKIMHRFNGAKWTLPASVYARPLEVYEGKAINQKDFIAELKSAGYRRSSRSQSRTFHVSADTVSIHTRAFTFWDKPQPALTLDITFSASRIVQIEGLERSMNGAFRLEPIKIGSIHPQQHEERLVIAYDDIPEALIEALLATEDRNFFNHYGISLKGIGRAAWSNIRQGAISQGASTITQQLVKNLFLTSDRTLTRKLEEVLMAVLLELRATKAEILETYVNEVFVAQDGSRAIHGFALASEFFFAKPLKQLTDSQIALLVGMMKGPSYYNPIRHPRRAIARRNLVLSLMNEQGYLSTPDFLEAENDALGLMLKPDPSSTKSYAAYIQLVKQQLLQDYSQNDLQTQGLNVFTNLNPQLQAHAQLVMNRGLKRLERRYGKRMGQSNGAIVVVNHASGDVEALVGGKDFRPGSFNRALYAYRPIGSLVKPAVYLSAIEKGYRLSDLISDEPVKVEIDNEVWEPKNYDRKTHHLDDVIKSPRNVNKDIPLYMAMAKSYNVATVRLGLQVGVDAVADTLVKLGVSTNIPKVPSLLLGALDLTPIQAAQVFSTIGASGFYAPLNAIREVSDSKGQALKRYKIELEKRFDNASMYLITYAMQAVMHEGTGRSVADKFSRNRLIAGKTGTTNDLRDNWFAGFNSERAAVVWVGNDDNKPLAMPASLGALPIWADLMSAYPSAAGRPPIPDDIDYSWVDIATDQLTEEGCPNAVYLPFKKGSAPTSHTQCYLQQQTEHWFNKWFQ